MTFSIHQEKTDVVMRESEDASGKSVSDEMQIDQEGENENVSNIGAEKETPCLCQWKVWVTAEDGITKLTGKVLNSFSIFYFHLVSLFIGFYDCHSNWAI